MLQRVRGLVAVVVLGVVAATVMSPSALAAPRQQRMSEATCDAFTDYFQVNFALAFITGFAEAFGATEEEDPQSAADLDQIRSVTLLVLSPKLEESTSVLARRGPRPTRALFREQHDIYTEGVRILQDDLGLTDDQIQEIRDAELEAAAGDELADEVDLTKEELDAAATTFGESVETLNAEDLSTRQEHALNRLASGCGTVPIADLDCDTLVAADMRDALLGEPSTAENDDGTCDYTVATDDGVDSPELGVEVYATERSFDRLVETLDAADKVSDDAYLVDNFTTPASFRVKTCGSTLFMRTSSRTVVVAACLPGDAEVNVDDLTEIADTAAESLDA
jgi:hypothetical protein